jgi:hypothetical protein
MKNRKKHPGKKHGSDKPLDRKSAHSPVEETPVWQQNAGKGRNKGRNANGFRSQPHSVGKRYWRM